MNTKAIREEQAQGPIDALLLTEVAAGNQEAFAGIIRRHNQRMFRIARSIVTDDAEAMDAVQEAFIAAYERLGDLKDPAALGVWLGRIVRNTALMRLRSARRYLFMDDSDLENVMELSVLQLPQRSPDGEVANIQLRRLLEQCIDELPDAFRTVFVLRAVDECSTSDTAEILEIEQATVKTRFHRAKRLIQQRLLACAEATGVGVHEFAGHRCDTIVHNVMEALRQKQLR